MYAIRSYYAKIGREVQPRQEPDAPCVSRKMVDAGQRNRPIDRSSLPRKEIKPLQRERPPAGYDQLRGRQMGAGRQEHGPMGRQNIRQDTLQGTPVGRRNNFV